MSSQTVFDLDDAQCAVEMTPPELLIPAEDIPPPEQIDDGRPYWLADVDEHDPSVVRDIAVWLDEWLVEHVGAIPFVEQMRSNAAAFDEWQAAAHRAAERERAAVIAAEATQ